MLVVAVIIVVVAVVVGWCPDKACLSACGPCLFFANNVYLSCKGLKCPLFSLSPIPFAFVSVSRPPQVTRAFTRLD